MSDSTSVWYRLGWALEEAKARIANVQHTVSGRGAGRSDRADARARLIERLHELRDLAPARTDARAGRRSSATAARGDETAHDLVGLLRTVGTGGMSTLLFDLWPTRGRGRARGARLLRAAAAGAGASLLRELLHMLSHRDLRLPDLDERLLERVAAGVARGLLYGALADPRLPGPPALRGLLYGSAEYVLEPVGGLNSLAGRHAPHRALPVVGALIGEVVDAWESGDEGLVDHLVFGLTLALLYGDDPDDPDAPDDSYDPDDSSGIGDPAR